MTGERSAPASAEETPGEANGERSPVFLSYPMPHLKQQQSFLRHVQGWLRASGLEPRTLGVDERSSQAPLSEIRAMMMDSNGLVTIAFSRMFVRDGCVNYGADLDDESRKPRKVKETWYSSPYCQIEPAMAFQLRLPVLILRESSVVPEGVLEEGVSDAHMCEFPLVSESGGLLVNNVKWKESSVAWLAEVRNIVAAKGQSPGFAPRIPDHLGTAAFTARRRPLPPR